MKDKRQADSQAQLSCERLGDLAGLLVPAEARSPGAEQWAEIDRRLDGIDLCHRGELWLACDGEAAGEIGQSRRIGVTRAVENLSRFYVRDNPYVSGPKALNR